MLYIKWLLQVSFYLCLILAGGLSYAYVYDVEPLTAQKHYLLERDVYNHSDRAVYNDFPTFNEWLDQQEGKERRLSEYLADLRAKFREECAYCFDWTLPDPSKPMSAEQWRAAYGD